MFRSLSALPRPALVAVAIVLCAAGAVAEEVQTLAVVGEDTLTTTDLKVELGIMVNVKPDIGRTLLPEGQQVLKRLIQNRLIQQEGYRMGLHEEFVVANQVDEFVRSRAVKALMDSVVAAVPDDVEDPYETRRLAAETYLRNLREEFGVEVDSLLLQSLDYASADPEVQKSLREDRAVLARVPRGELTVAGFSRILRFTEFHGLVGKTNAAEKRDKHFHQWLAEAVLHHQVDRQKMLEQDVFVTLRERMERNTLQQETLQRLLQFDFAPSEEQIEAFYQEHIAEFTAPARIRVESLKVPGHEAAQELHDKMAKGTPISWLARNFEPVIDGPPPFPTDLMVPEKIGLKIEDVEVGYVSDPYQVPSGWVVARVTEIEQPAPAPLAGVRNQVLTAMKGAKTTEMMTGMIAQLEEFTPVTVMPGAEERVDEIIAEFFAARYRAEDENLTSPSQEG